VLGSKAEVEVVVASNKKEQHTQWVGNVWGNKLVVCGK